MKLTSPAFNEGDTIPKKYTCDGEDISPALNWQGVPKETMSLALICDDPDAPHGTWVHWVLFNLAAEVTELREHVTPVKEPGILASQGVNDFKHIGYGGPCPPAGKPHRYFFKLYALDRRLDLEAGATKQQLEAAMKGHILAEGQLMGTYGR